MEQHPNKKQLDFPEPEGGWNDDDFITLDEAAERFGVVRGNIEHFIRQGVPKRTMPHRIPQKTKNGIVKEVIHVHLPSLEVAKEGRLWKPKEVTE